MQNSQKLMQQISLLSKEKQFLVEEFVNSLMKDSRPQPSFRESLDKFKSEHPAPETARTVTVYLSIDELIQINLEMVEEFGGTAGVRDRCITNLQASRHEVPAQVRHCDQPRLFAQKKDFYTIAARSMHP